MMTNYLKTTYYLKQLILLSKKYADVLLYVKGKSKMYNFCMEQTLLSFFRVLSIFSADICSS